MPLGTRGGLGSEQRSNPLELGFSGSNQVVLMAVFAMAQPSPRRSVRERFNISKWAILNPWPTIAIWIVVIIAGCFAFGSLRYALFPDVTFPVVVVSAAAPMTAATDTESTLTIPMEEGLRSLEGKPGLTNLRSTTYPGRAIVSLSFEVGTKLDAAKTAVQTTLDDLKPKLPKGATYEVRPINLNEAAVVSYAIQAAGKSLATLTQTVQTEVLPAIADVPGVLKVTLAGVPAQAKVQPAQPTKSVELAVLKPGSSAVRFDGKDVLAVEVVKRSDANTLEVVRRVEAAIAKLRQTNPNLTLTLASTQADYINEATHSTIEALILAVILSVVCIYPFLWDWKATVISALAIPTSLCGTFIVMALFGYNLETITLLAVALVVGIVVDDAIVDVENIARHLEMGESPRDAAIHATEEIGLTVTAATLTIAAVFIPVALMEGVVGQFFRPFGLTVSAAVLISLLVARTLSPTLAAYWLRSRSPAPTANPVATASQGMVGWYRQALAWSLDHRAIVALLATLSFVAGLALIPFMPTGFIPKLDRGEFNVRFTAPLPKAPDPATLARLAQTAAKRPPGDAIAGGGPLVESGQNLPKLPSGVSPEALAAKQLPNLNPLTDAVKVAKELETAVLRSNSVASVFTTVGTRQQPNAGTIYVKLKGDRTQTTIEVQDEVRQALPTAKGVTTSVEDIQFVDTGGEKPLQVELLGDDPVALTTVAKAVKKRLEKEPGFVDVSVSGEANTKNLIVEINRENGLQVAYVSANLEEGMALGKATRQVEAIAKNEINQQQVGDRVTLDRGSDSARVDEIFDSFKITLGLSTLSVFVVLVLLFKNLVDPFVVALSLPLAIVGALVASLLTRSEFGMISIIGIIFLLGLDNKSAILLVDYINQLRRSGLSRTDAILTAGPVRLRPILMTTAATILGMLPIALGLGAGAELRAPMAITIIGGLFTSTVLSLIVVPVVYALLDDLRDFTQRKFKR